MAARKAATAKVASVTPHATPTKGQKFVQDKKAIKRMKKVKRSVEKYIKHVSNDGTDAKFNVRVKHGKDLLEIVKEMLRDEMDGWVDLPEPKTKKEKKKGK